MSAHYPRIRIQTESGYIRVREGLSLTFYMSRAHPEIAQVILRALEIYLRSVEPGALGVYASEEGEWRELDAAGWELIRRKLLESRLPLITLEEDSETGSRYAFRYRGRDDEYRARMNEPHAVCEATFWLPTEFMEDQGPERVRALAIELATLLPVSSGSCGLSFNGELDMLGVSRALEPSVRRYPGIDLPSSHGFSSDIGTRIRGPHWVNFLGLPILRQVGGVEGLRARLHSSGITVRELTGEKVVVTLGEWPEAGDAERGDLLPAYRELARVLEPWLYHRRGRMLRLTEEETRRWERRFLI